jgi:hydrogenase nickel incorporation protein HypB
MCVVCGCSDTTHPNPEASGTGAAHAHHGHSHSYSHYHSHDLHFGAGEARVSVPGMSQARAIKLEADILGANNAVARQNRTHFAAHGVTALNLVSSPGSGKTTLLCATIEALKARSPQLAVAVIEGDQQTSFDADRIRATGAPAIQVNTGKGCHLDAPMVAQAYDRLHDKNKLEQTNEYSKAPELLFIENVGNLVCPALWDLGEAAKVAILSVTEGEDKPLKYPDMFAAASLMVLNKIDLLPHVRFDVARCIALARRVNPAIEVLQLSATTGQGMDTWLHWLDHCMDHQTGRPHHHPGAPAGAPVAAPSEVEQGLRQRVRELEAALAQAQAQTQAAVR